MSNRFAGTCLIVIGLGAMILGIAWQAKAKCRTDAIACCFSVPIIGLDAGRLGPEAASPPRPAPQTEAGTNEPRAPRHPSARMSDLSRAVCFTFSFSIGPNFS